MQSQKNKHNIGVYDLKFMVKVVKLVVVHMGSLVPVLF